MSKINTLNDVLVRVLPDRYVKEYTGTTSVKTREVPESDWSVVLRLEDAIENRHATSAHFQTMNVPGYETVGKKYPRVGRSWALELWRDDELPADALPWFDVLVLDLDHGDKKTSDWSKRSGKSPSDEAFFTLIDRLRERHGFAWYLSRTGARLIGRLAEPVTVDVYEHYMQRFLLDLARTGFPVFEPDEHGHHIDAACADLGRLFKLPLVPKSHPDAFGDTWYETTFERDIDFKPGASLRWSFAKRGGAGIGRPTTPPPAQPKTIPTKDLKPLSKLDVYSMLTTPKPIGSPGARHEPMIRLAGLVARRLDTGDPELVYHVMYPCVAESLTTSDRPSDLFDELWEIAHYVTACYEAEVEANVELERARSSLRAKALSRIAEITGCDWSEASTRIALATNKGVFYVFDEDEDQYSTVPYRANMLASAFAKHCPNLVRLRTENGGYVSDRTLALKYSASDLTEVVYVYGSSKVRADLKARRLYLPTVAIRDDLTPTYHEDIATWFAKLAGSEHHEDFLTWCALFPDHTRPLCALYLNAQAGAGKNVLVQGLANMYGAAPVPFSCVGDRFQSPLLTSPVLHADEKMRLAASAQRNLTAIFREVIGSSSMMLEQKGLDQVRVEGFRRVIITANNKNALGIQEDLSGDDIAAVQERVGYIDAPRGPALDFIMTKSWDEIGEWIEFKIPEHVLYLAENLDITAERRRSRFASWDSSFVRSAKIEIGSARVVAEVIATWFDRLPVDESEWSNIGLFASSSGLFVRSSRLSKRWGDLIDAKANPLPNSRALATAMRALAPEGVTTSASMRVNGRTIRAWEIDPAKVVAACETTDIDTEQLRARFEVAASAEHVEAVPKPMKRRLDTTQQSILDAWS